MLPSNPSDDAQGFGTSGAEINEANHCQLPLETEEQIEAERVRLAAEFEQKISSLRSFMEKFDDSPEAFSRVILRYQNDVQSLCRDLAEITRRGHISVSEASQRTSGKSAARREAAQARRQRVLERPEAFRKFADLADADIDRLLEEMEKTRRKK